MEHTQANPKTHTCAMCGYVWLHGQHGGHSCDTRLKSQRDELLAGLTALTSRMAESHHMWPELQAAVALIAKHKEASHG